MPGIVAVEPSRRTRSLAPIHMRNGPGTRTSRSGFTGGSGGYETYRSVTARTVCPNWFYIHDCNQVHIGESCGSRLPVSHHDHTRIVALRLQAQHYAKERNEIIAQLGEYHERVRDRWLGG